MLQPLFIIKDHPTTNIGPESLLRVVTICWIWPPGKRMYVKAKQTAIDHSVSKPWKMDTLGFEPRAFRMRSGCDTTTPCALCPWRWPLAYIAKNENFLFVRGAGQECGSRGNVTWRFQAMSDIDSGKHKERHRQRHPPWGSNPRPQG